MCKQIHKSAISARFEISPTPQGPSNLPKVSMDWEKLWREIGGASPTNKWVACSIEPWTEKSGSKTNKGVKLGGYTKNRQSWLVDRNWVDYSLFFVLHSPFSHLKYVILYMLRNLTERERMNYLCHVIQPVAEYFPLVRSTAPVLMSASMHVCWMNPILRFHRPYLKSQSSRNPFLRPKYILSF